MRYFKTYPSLGITLRRNDCALRARSDPYRHGYLLRGNDFYVCCFGLRPFRMALAAVAKADIIPSTGSVLAIWAFKAQRSPCCVAVPLVPGEGSSLSKMPRIKS